MNKYVCLIFLLIGIDKSVQQLEKKYVGYKGISVQGDVGGLRSLQKAFDDVEGVMYLQSLDGEDNYLVSSELLDTFQGALKYSELENKIVYQNFSEIIESEISKPKKLGDEFSWDTYHGLYDINVFLETMERRYPEQSKLIVGGKSYEGRDILGLRIISPYQEDEGKPAVFIESGIHAREWITPATATYFINELLTSNDPKIQHLRDTYDWHIFPTVNPDGYHYSHTKDRMWRKTRSQSENGCFGADPNRNWDHNWNEFGSSKNPCHYELYSGNKPFSEIETLTLSQYIGGIQNLLAYIGVHADAQMLLLPYSDSKEHFDNYDDLVKIGKTSLAYGEEVNGAKYRGPATAAEILYKVSGGSMDWVREALGTPLVFTYELRGKYFHWPPNRIPEQGDELTQMILGLITQSEEMDYFRSWKRKINTHN